MHNILKLSTLYIFICITQSIFNILLPCFAYDTWQKLEINGVLARNVEFSQLIVDYQRKLRESLESLNAAEELSRKLNMEVEILLGVLNNFDPST